MVCRMVTAAAGLLLAVQAKSIQPSDTIPGYLANYGIKVQEHYIVTDDGYNLTAFRLPRPGAPVALLQHGILCSAWFWITNEPSIAPGLQLYDMGYDVWLTNNRGNTYSRRHTSLDPQRDRRFWDFSFADMGRHDVPANIEYILQQTGKTTLTYVGHSQGTSQFFAAMTDPKLKSAVEQKVNLFVALNPVTYMQHQQGTLLNIISKLRLGAVVEAAFPYGFLDVHSLPRLANFFCKVTFGALCKLTVDLICGVSKLDHPAAITNITAHFPAGTSVKCLDHYEQFIDSDYFRDFDYGEKENLVKYNAEVPPSFDLSAAKVPTALFIGGHDDLGDPVDELRASRELPKDVLVFNETFADFSHITFFAGVPSSFPLWFPKMTALIQTYNPLPSAPNTMVV